MSARAARWVVLPFGGYPDTASDYVACATKLEVEAQLVDYGWMDNPGVSVYKVGPEYKGDAAALIANLSTDPDPYPDYVVERGARGGVVWSRA